MFRPNTIKKWPEHQSNQSNRKKNFLKSGKEPKIRMEATRQNLSRGLRGNAGYKQ
jgi:hypothetical protein